MSAATPHSVGPSGTPGTSPLATLIRLPEDAQSDGIHRYADELAQALERSPHAVETFNAPRHELQIGPLRVGGYLSQMVWKRIGRLPDAPVVHAVNPVQMHRATNVVTVHDTFALDRPERYGWNARVWQGALDRFRNVDAVITPSQYTKDCLLEHDLVPAKRVHVIPHGIDVDRYRPDVETVPEMDDGRRHLLMVGNLRERKRTLEVVEALEALDDVVLHLAGPVRPHLAYDRKVRERARAIDAPIRFWGYVDDEQLARMYASADLHVFPSSDEGWGFPPVEAAAAGTPSLVADHPVYEETLGPLRHTWGDEPLEAAIEAALSDRIDATRLRARAERFTWRRCAEKHLSVYQHVAIMNGVPASEVVNPVQAPASGRGPVPAAR